MEKIIQRIEVVVMALIGLTSAVALVGSVMLFLEAKALLDKIFPG